MPWNKKYYPPNWSEIRTRILKRARNKCEICGVNNYDIINKSDRTIVSFQQLDMVSSKCKYGGYSYSQSLKIHGLTKIILTIAHLDHDKHNHEVRDDRLQALCQRCHLNLDMKQHVSNRINNKHKNNLKLF